MSGRRFAVVLVAVGAVALGLELRRAAGLWRASLLIGAVAHSTTAVAADGRLPVALVEQGLRQLEAAERLAPSGVAPAMYRGSLYLLSGRPRAAIRAYRAAAELEPRAEVYANLGRAYLELGEKEQARWAFETAVALGGRYQQLQVAPLYQRAVEGGPARAMGVPTLVDPAAGGGEAP